MNGRLMQERRKLHASCTHFFALCLSSICSTFSLQFTALNAMSPNLATIHINEKHRNRSTCRCQA